MGAVNSLIIVDYKALPTKEEIHKPQMSRVTASLLGFNNPAAASTTATTPPSLKTITSLQSKRATSPALRFRAIPTGDFIQSVRKKVEVGGSHIGPETPRRWCESQKISLAGVILMLGVTVGEVMVRHSDLAA